MTANRRPRRFVLVLAALVLLTALPLQADGIERARKGFDWLDLLNWLLPDWPAGNTTPGRDFEVLSAGGSRDPDGAAGTVPPPTLELGIWAGPEDDD